MIEVKILNERPKGPQALADLERGSYLADIGMSESPCFLVVGHHCAVALDLDDSLWSSRPPRSWRRDSNDYENTKIRNARRVKVAAIEVEEVF